jgi:hypothetical protein
MSSTRKLAPILVADVATNRKNATAPKLILGTEFMFMSAHPKHRSPTNGHALDPKARPFRATVAGATDGL